MKLISLLVIMCLLVVRVASYSLTIRPVHVRVSTDPETVSYTCTADAALTACQFRWLDWHRAGPLLDLSRGFLTQFNSTHLGSELTGYSYSGRGLGAGDCGVSLQVKGEKLWMVACRVRAETGGWTYAWADFFSNSYGHLPHTLTPRESVVLPGGEARFRLNLQEPLSECYFHPTGMARLDFDRGAKSNYSTGRHLYLGAGLEGGECGLVLSNVSEADNGPVLGYIHNEAWTKQNGMYMLLIVARPPGGPTLSVVYTDAGVTATCVVHEGRPLASISWVLGDDIVRQDSLDDSPGTAQDEWRWPWMQGSILQTLTLGLRAQDNGKVLKCVASHVALAQPLEVTEIILFTESVNSTTARTTIQSLTTPLDSTSTTGRTTVETFTTPVETTTISNPAISTVETLTTPFDTTSNSARSTAIENSTTHFGTTTTSNPARSTVETLTTPLETTSNSVRTTVETSSTAPSPNTSLGPTPVPTCTVTSMLGVLCQEYGVRESQLVNPSCTSDEVYELRVREARAAARAAELIEYRAMFNLEVDKSSAKADAEIKEMLAKADAEAKATLSKMVKEQAKVTLEMAKVNLEVANFRARAEEARTREEEAWAKNAEEELVLERERRIQSMQQLQSLQRAHGLANDHTVPV